MSLKFITSSHPRRAIAEIDRSIDRSIEAKADWAFEKIITVDCKFYFDIFIFLFYFIKIETTSCCSGGSTETKNKKLLLNCIVASYVSHR